MGWLETRTGVAEQSRAKASGMEALSVSILLSFSRLPAACCVTGAADAISARGVGLVPRR